MKYRKIFALLLAAATLFSLAACGETAAGPETTPDPALDESAATVSGQTLTFAGAADDVFSLSLDYGEPQPRQDAEHAQSARGLPRVRPAFRGR